MSEPFRHPFRDNQGRPMMLYSAARRVRDGGPRVHVRLGEVDGRVACVGVEIGPALIDATFEKVLQLLREGELEQAAEIAREIEGDEWKTPKRFEASKLRPVTTSDLRIPLARLADEALLRYVRHLEAWGDEGAPEQFAVTSERRLPAARAGAEAKKRPGRPVLHDPAEVAAVYRAHSGGRSPTKAVAEHFGVSKSAAAKLVARAREKGALERYGE